MALALASVLVWAFVLPLTQPQQQLRRQVEKDIREGRFEAALQTMSVHPPHGFPPHWDPPPREAHASVASLASMTSMAACPGVADWVRETYVQKLERQMDNRFFWYRLDEDDLVQLAHCLESLPEGAALVERHRESIAALMRTAGDGPSEESPGLRALRRLIAQGRGPASSPG